VFSITGFKIVPQRQHGKSILSGYPWLSIEIDSNEPTMNGYMIDGKRNHRYLHGWLSSIALLNCATGNLSRPNGHPLDTLGWLFGSDDSPDVSGCSSLMLCFLHGARSNVASVSIPLAIFIPSQLGIALIMLWLNPTSYHKPTKSSSLTSRFLCHFRGRVQFNLLSFFIDSTFLGFAFVPDFFYFQRSIPVEPGHSPSLKNRANVSIRPLTSLQELIIAQDGRSVRQRVSNCTEKRTKVFDHGGRTVGLSNRDSRACQ
jgi:hypothetical protein